MALAAPAAVGARAAKPVKMIATQFALSHMPRHRLANLAMPASLAMLSNEQSGLNQA